MESCVQCIISLSHCLSTAFTRQHEPLSSNTHKYSPLPVCHRHVRFISLCFFCLWWFSSINKMHLFAHRFLPPPAAVGFMEALMSTESLKRCVWKGTSLLKPAACCISTPVTPYLIVIMRGLKRYRALTLMCFIVLEAPWTNIGVPWGTDLQGATCHSSRCFKLFRILQTVDMNNFR